MRALLLLLITATLAQAQGPDTLWTRIIYNPGGTWVDKGVDTHDGGGLVTGVYTTAGKWDAWLVRYKPNGDTAWSRRYGGAYGDYGRDVVRLADSGYVMLGKRQTSLNGDYFVWLLRVDTNGTTKWEKVQTRTENPWGLTRGADSGFAIAATRESPTGSMNDIVVIRTNSRGDTVWTRRFGGPQADDPVAITATADSGFLVLSNTQSYGGGNGDLYLLKVSKRGDSLWARTFGGTQYDVARKVESTSDGNYIIVGGTYSFGVSGNVYAVKVNPSGGIIWESKVGGPGADAYDCVETPDGGFLLAGKINPVTPNNNNFYLARIDNQGRFLWAKSVGTSVHEYAAFVQRLPGGFPLVVGTYASTSGIYAVKFGEDVVGVADEPAMIPDRAALSEAYPNPFNGTTVIEVMVGRREQTKVEVLDLLGRVAAVLLDEVKDPGRYRVRFGASGLPTGVYFCRLRSGDVSQTRRLLLLR